MNKSWIIADTHWGHKNILGFANRPFANIKEHDELLISNWNNVVGENDTVHHLGDVAYRCTMDYALNIMKRLNGIKHLVVGNHDDDLALRMNNIRPNTWASIKYYDEVEYDRQRIILFHYPMRTWHWNYKGTIQLFGHVHGHMPPYGKSFDIGVDCWNYTPVSLEQVMAKAAKLPISEIIKNKWNKTDDGLTDV